MDKLDKNMKIEKDNLSEATVPDEALDQVAGGSTYEEFRRYATKEDKSPEAVRNSIKRR